MDSPSAPRNFHVSYAGGALLLLLVARPAEYRVRMGIDETGRQNASPAVDFLCAVKLPREYPPGARPRR